MKMLAYGASDCGLEREKNEDSFVVDDELALYVVCDGMGGHEFGKLASETAAKVVQNVLKVKGAGLKTLSEGGSRDAAALSAVREAIERACDAVYQEGKKRSSSQGMGTTLTLLWILGDYAVMGHVGDSRLYLLRDGKLHQLSRDHTLIQELVDQGAISRAAMKTSPYAHVLSRAVGIQESVQVDTIRLEVLPDDLFLLCSDGLADVTADQGSLCRLLETEDALSLPARLIERANIAGGHDNITALVVEARETPQESKRDRRRSDEVSLQITSLKQVYIFKELELQQLVRVIDKAVVVNCEIDEYLFREGDTSTNLFVILEGQLKVVKGDRLLAQLAPGNHVGEMALLSGLPRSASVVATKHSRLLRLEQNDFLNLVREEPVMGTQLLIGLARELSARLITAIESA